jgi:hypothetical protein
MPVSAHREGRLGYAVGEFVKGESRAEANDAVRNELGSHGERMIGVERRVGELIKPSA